MGIKHISEKPILFSGEMVRAILEGRKTETRRIMNPQPVGKAHSRSFDIDDGDTYIDGDTGIVYKAVGSNGKNKRAAGILTPKEIPCPYGKPGNKLWVRETWRSMRCVQVGKYDIYPSIHKTRPAERGHFVAYKATDNGYFDTYIGFRWKPSIHMPRWASRISLEITEIKCERLQDMDGHDILAEGVDNGMSNPAMGVRWHSQQRMAFQQLWDSLNADSGYSWESNPWVWVVKFKLLQSK